MSGGPPRALSSRIAQSFVACESVARQYGVCAVRNVDSIQQGCCEKEYQQLAQCFRQFVSDAMIIGTRY